MTYSGSTHSEVCGSQGEVDQPIGGRVTMTAEEPIRWCVTMTEESPNVWSQCEGGWPIVGCVKMKIM